jgi:sporulation protein YlmC with PRC-barrel domain
MNTNTAGIENGMTVYDLNGEKIGTVDDVLTVEAHSQTGMNDPYAAGSGGDFGTTVSSSAGETTVLKVSQGGVLGIGAKDLYVPFDAIQNIVPGDGVTVNCTKDQCSNLYAQKPSFLSSNV